MLIVPQKQPPSALPHAMACFSTDFKYLPRQSRCTCTVFIHLRPPPAGHVLPNNRALTASEAVCLRGSETSLEQGSASVWWDWNPWPLPFGVEVPLQNHLPGCEKLIKSHLTILAGKRTKAAPLPIVTRNVVRQPSSSGARAVSGGPVRRAGAADWCR